MSDTPEPISASHARALTERIKHAVENTWQLIKQAYETRAWEALGYESWDAYCSTEFSAARLRLPREERPDIVGSLREAGLSTRAIGAALGIDHTTVVRDIATGGANAPGDAPPTQIVGTDGKTYPATNTPPEDNGKMSRADQIRDAVARGLTRQQIADEVGIKPGLVSSYAHRHGIVLDPDGGNTKDAVQARIDAIREGAAAGASSRQLGAQLGIDDRRVRVIAKRHGINIHADAIVANTHRLDHTRIIRSTIEDTYGIGALLDSVDWAQVDLTDADAWVEQLADAIRALTALRQAITKERGNRGQ